MKTSDITDPLFLEAVNAVDSGNAPLLKRLINENPRLVRDPLDHPEEGYFKNPYLIWFIADNPIRNEKLPVNIGEITQLLIKAVKEFGNETYLHQINYALGLVTTGRIPKECGVQIELMDLLIDAGATPGEGHGAIAHGNLDAARHLIERGGKLTLAVAVCLNLEDDIKRMAENGTDEDRQVALVAAAFYGKVPILQYLINIGTDVNTYLKTSSGFHSHATALHQAVYSGSLESVKVLVEAGGNLDAKDRMYNGTPLGWALHMQTEAGDESLRKKYRKIEEYLKSQIA